MNRNMKACLFLSVMALSLSAGCLGLKQPAIKVDYYQIEYDSVKRSKPEQLDIVLGVRHFGAAAAFNNDRMVYREGKHEWQTYYYHRWITNATEMVRDALLRDLQLSNNYRAVVPVPGTTPWGYEIRGYVQDIYENDLGASWKSVIDLNITFIKTPPRTSRRRVIFQKNYHASVPSESKDPKAVVAAMSAAMQIISIELQQDIYSAVKEDKKKEAEERARAAKEAEAEKKARASKEAEEAETKEAEEKEVEIIKEEINLMENLVGE